jgi:hypothetical protein
VSKNARRAARLSLSFAASAGIALSLGGGLGALGQTRNLPTPTATPSFTEIIGPATSAQGASLRVAHVTTASRLAVDLGGTTITGSFSGTVAATQSGTWNVGVTSLPSLGTVAVSGPLTDAQLRAASVPVSGTFFQATQPVSGSVAVSSLPAISGTVAVSSVGGTVAVTGPLTDAQLRATAVPVSGTVASTQSGTWTVQPGNTANTTAWKVDGSAVTQPVSGTVTANQGGAPWSVSGSGVFHVDDNAGSLTIDSTQFPATLGQKTMANSLAIAIASDQTALAASQSGTWTVQAAQSGTWNVGTVTALTAITNALPAGSNVIGHVIADTGSTTAVTGNVTVTQATGTNLHTVIDSGTTTVTQATGTNLHTVVDSGTITALTSITNPVAVTGPLTDAQLRATAVPISASSLPLPSNAAAETGGNLATIAGKDFATSAKQDTAQTSLTAITASMDVVDNTIGTRGAAGPTQGQVTGGIDQNGNFQPQRSTQDGAQIVFMSPQLPNQVFPPCNKLRRSLCR